MNQAVIQIVDDDIRDARLLEAQLKSEGYEVMCAYSGEECLAQLKARLPDLILLDIMMPGMSGFDVAGRLKAEARTKTIPIIMVTALDDHERWDGTGYPDGRLGEEIPFAARLMNIADQYDALRAKRPYKPAFPHERAVEIITVGDGRTRPAHFDPQVLAAFARCAERWREIYDTNAD